MSEKGEIKCRVQRRIFQRCGDEFKTELDIWSIWQGSIIVFRADPDIEDEEIGDYNVLLYVYDDRRSERYNE